MTHQSREDVIRQFHEAFGQEIGAEASAALLTLRRTLINEEVKELFADIDTALQHLEAGEEVSQELWRNMLKEMADVQVVLSGMSVALKPLQKLGEAFDRVHASNMSKLGEDGKPIYREDGKVLKGPHYTSPDLSDLVL